jgi:hypothetical protein
MSFFDDIFENKRFTEDPELFKKFLLEQRKETSEPVVPPSIIELQKILDKSRIDKGAQLTMDEAKLIDARNKQNISEAKTVMKQISKIKSDLIDDIKNNGDGFTLSLRNKSRLKNCANAIFGSNKEEITYDDYITLLELKKLLDYEDGAELLQGEYE